MGVGALQVYVTELLLPSDINCYSRGFQPTHPEALLKPAPTSCIASINRNFSDSNHTTLERGRTRILARHLPFISRDKIFCRGAAGWLPGGIGVREVKELNSHAYCYQIQGFNYFDLNEPLPGEPGSMTTKV